MRRLARVLLFVAISLCSLAQVVGQLPLSAPVKVLPTGTTQNDPTMQKPGAPPRRPRPEPTMPGGKLPQYQLDDLHLEVPAAGELQNPRLRLILALPAQAVLIEVSITIDGEPFRMIRE